MVNMQSLTCCLKGLWLLTDSAFSKTQLVPELWRVLSYELPAVFLHTPLEEKGPWGPLYQLWWVPEISVSAVGISCDSKSLTWCRQSLWLTLSSVVY